jgi:exosortase
VTPSQPAYETVRSTNWKLAAGVLLGALAFAYAPLFVYSFNQWLKPDYSHGFLVPLFSAYLIYRWWPEAPRKLRWPEPWGLAFIAGGMALFFVAGFYNIAKEWLQGLSLVLNLSGAVLLLGGWNALKWCWPALAFLLFMFPLPHKVEHALGWYLQVIAARSSEFVLQTVGYPTYREGVILHVKEHTLEVQNACNGLSMLLTFLALSVGMVMIVKRPVLDKVLIILAAIPVAILANIIRISLTGVLYCAGGKELGDWLFHDFAGWLMMPIALGFLWVGLKLLDWVFVPDQGKASREEVIRQNAVNPAHLFMHAIPGADTGKPGTPSAKPAAPSAPAAQPAAQPGKPAPPAPGAPR